MEIQHHFLNNDSGAAKLAVNLLRALLTKHILGLLTVDEVQEAAREYTDGEMDVTAIEDLELFCDYVKNGAERPGYDGKKELIDAIVDTISLAQHGVVGYNTPDTLEAKLEAALGN